MGGRATDIETMSIGGKDRVASNTICIVYLDLISDTFTSVRTLMSDIVLATVIRSTFGVRMFLVISVPQQSGH